MQPTIASGFARTFLEFASSYGLSSVALLDAASLRESDLQQFEARVPLDRYLTLVRSAERASGDPLFILEFGRHVHATENSIVCVIGSTCETMAEAHAHLNRYARLTLDVGTRHGGAHFPLESTREGLWLIDDRDLPLAARQISEASLLRMTVGTRMVQASPPLVRAVHFRHKPAGDVARYEELFGVRVHFGQRSHALLLDPAWLSLRIRRVPAHVSDVLRERAAALLAALDEAHSVHRRVRDTLRTRMASGGDLTMGSTARALAMSRQTLYRMLRSEGVTYAQVLDQARRDVAMEIMSARSVSITHVAQCTGFSELAAFSRAFKRWTGRAPRDYLTARA